MEDDANVLEFGSRSQRNTWQVKPPIRSERQGNYEITYFDQNTYAEVMVLGQRGTRHVRRGSRPTVNGQTVPDLHPNELWLKAHQQWNAEVAAELARSRAELPYVDQWHDRVAILVGYVTVVWILLFFVLTLAAA